jgi:flagellar export protein FliJ
VKRFAFRLQRLVRVRAIEEQIAREGWALAERGARQSEECAERALLDVRAAREALRTELRSGRVLPAGLLQRQSLSDALVERRGLALQRARAARETAELQRAAWLGHKRKLEGLGRLEQRDLEAWRLEANAHDAAELDEVAAIRAARKARRETSEEPG